MTRRNYTVKYRRVLAGKTDYRLRLKLLKSGLPRLVIRRSLSAIRMQVVEYKPDGDRVVLAVDSGMLAKFGWRAGTGNTPAAYLTGLLLAKAAAGKIQKCVSDTGNLSIVKGGVLFAALAGAVEGGLSVSVAKEMFPSADRLAGKSIAAYAKLLMADKQKTGWQFAQYLKDGLNPEELPAHVASVKASIREAVIGDKIGVKK